MLNSTPSPPIVVEDLHKSYGEVQALRGVSLEVQTGEVFGLLGPNGAGKTTTVEILEGLRQRTSGKVFVLGFDPATEVKRIKDQIGVCLQATNLPDKMKVHEALELFAAFYSREVDRTKLLERLQLSEKRDVYYSRLSGGQKQRVALALALVNNPSLLFLDEPTTGLDPQVRHEIHGLIQELKQDHRSILLTTHYIEEAERLCDRVAFVDAGKIVEMGTPREIQRRVMGETLVEVTADAPLPLDLLPEALLSEPHTTRDQHRTLSLQTSSPTAAIVELVKWIDRQGLHLVDIHMKHPTLEDVFIKLTGRKLRE